MRKARGAAGLTQEDVAFAAGVSVRHYQELESGRLNPSYLTLTAVAAAIKVPLTDLVATTARGR